MSNHQMQVLLERLFHENPTLYSQCTDASGQMDARLVRKVFHELQPSDLSTMSVLQMIQKLVEFQTVEDSTLKPQVEIDPQNESDEVLIEDDFTVNTFNDSNVKRPQYNWQELMTTLQDIFLLEYVGQSEPELRAEQQAEQVISLLQDTLKDKDSSFDISAFESISKNPEFLFWVQVAQASNV